MSFAIIRNENHKIGNVPLAERHNERRNKHYSNEDIDLSRSEQNYHMKKPEGSYLNSFFAIREKEHLKGNLRVNGTKQSTILCEFVMTSDKTYFDRIGPERTRQFFEVAYRFACMKAGGEQYIVSAAVHMDETTPHMHLMFIPVVQGKDRKGQPCKRINCSEFWKGRDSYSRLQDEYHEWMTSHGFNLERGTKGSTAEHLTTEEYKLKKVQEQIAEATREIVEIEHIEEIRSKQLPANTSLVKTSDLETLTAAAKGYAAVKKSESEMQELKTEVSALRSENESLKSENAALSAKYQELDYQFGAFYDSVADEVALQRENERLRHELQNIGNQYHGICRDLETVTAERETLKQSVQEQAAEIKTLTEKLTVLQKLHQALTDRFNRVMRFIEQMQLKEKLEAFLKPKQHKL